MISDTSPCYCDSQACFSECCKHYLLGIKTPKTALALMRSRYSAYATANIDYIKGTMRGPALKGFDVWDAKKWAQSVRFTRLEVLNSTTNTVEFKAYYEYEGKQALIHENSLFELIEGLWYYCDKKGTDKIKRNAPCPCGSGKKYKYCCLS